jgi:hypothetical protein
VTLALSSEFPILDIFWTMLLVLGLALFVWLLVAVFRDLFGRADVPTWGKVLWVVGVFIFPIAGALAYLIGRGDAIETAQHRRRQNLDTDVRADAYLRTVAGNEGFYGVHDVTATREAMSGPIRPD